MVSVIPTNLPMNTLLSLLSILIVTGCKPKPNTSINAAAVHVSGTFMAEYVQSSLTLRIKGARSIKKEGDNNFSVTGSVEGFSSYNVPFSVEHFNETVHYLGGDINDVKNWQCLEIYVEKKRLK